MRKPIIAGNWKMNKLVDEAVALVEGLKAEVGDVDAVEMVVLPDLYGALCGGQSPGRIQD